MGFSVEFNGKPYEIKTLFVRDEARLFKFQDRLNGGSAVIKARQAMAAATDPAEIAELTKAYDAAMDRVDLVDQVDAAVEYIHLLTGIDKGDLNGIKHVPQLLDLRRQVSESRRAMLAAEEPAPDEDQAEASGSPK